MDSRLKHTGMTGGECTGMTRVQFFENHYLFNSLDKRESSDLVFPIAK